MDINKIRKLKHLPISHLSLIILDDKTDTFLKECAEIELRKRIKLSDDEYKGLLNSES